MRSVWAMGQALVVPVMGDRVGQVRGMWWSVRNQGGAVPGEHHAFYDCFAAPASGASPCGGQRVVGVAHRVPSGVVTDVRRSSASHS